MKDTDKKRIENLKVCLNNQVDLLERTHIANDYLHMSEYASNIVKLAYAIGYLQDNENL